MLIGVGYIVVPFMTSAEKRWISQSKTGKDREIKIVFFTWKKKALEVNT